jgi:hypothetical protein
MLFAARRAGVSDGLRRFLSAGLDVPPFNEAFVAVAPAGPGVYFLYRHHQVIYIGIAVHGTGIRQQLEKHLEGVYGQRTRRATAFDFEETRDPVVASREYLLAYMAQHRGRRPVCNDLET